MTDFNELMKQAREMQEQLQKQQEELKNTVSVGEAGAGLVRVHMNGKHDVLEVKVDDSLLQEEKEVVEDLLAAAVNDAVRKVEESNRQAFGSMAGGLNLPEGFKFPF